MATNQERTRNALRNLTLGAAATLRNAALLARYVLKNEAIALELERAAQIAVEASFTFE